ncbi:MAG: glycerol-3-phosphate ABC transporter ATP-binding protein [Legionellales bacterium RIFCSPHIGHO2_12_FULL_42_9]|nr:MAG: glycerol-3-phosphate ABC transporter ATP-binding protein [Legionellales bacterium RIFCSPHIGHO2_12_FULL_42_9]
MATVNLVEVSKHYGQHSVLDKIDLSIEKGEFVVVVGPSGCGKSTLLRLIAGLDEPTSGQISINKQCVNEIPAPQRDMAMVFQSYALYPHMSVFDNMAYSLKMRRVKIGEIKVRVAKVAEMLQLTPFLSRKPRELSGGQKQRVAMGRAIVRQPAVFLFDEPLSNLDAKLRTEMRYEIKKIYQALKTTCIYVTHDQTEAMTMATRIVILNNGKIEQVGTPQMLYHEPASLFVAEFTGHYSTNFLPGVVDYENGRFIMDLGPSLPLPNAQQSIKSGDEVILGVRPEYVELITNQQHADSIPVSVEFIDDMGADKLIHTRTTCGRATFTVRIPSGKAIDCDNLAVRFLIDKANLFHGETGKRIGGWSDGKNS